MKINREQFKAIKWNQNKFVIPTIIYIGLMAAGYFAPNLLHIETLELKDNSLQSTEYLNPELPNAQLNNDGIGGRYENMAKSFGKIQDYSAVENIDRDDDSRTNEDYDSKYTDEDLAYLDQEAANRTEELDRLASMQDRLRQSAEKGNALATETNESAETSGEKRQQEIMAELTKALAEARLKGQKGVEDVKEAIGNIASPNAVEAEDDNTVVKKVQTNSDYFNTLADNESEPKLIKAIIDENITAVDGSRVRLRLLDDIEINEVVVPKGSYIYATMSGFGSQRVKGNVKSLMVDDELVKVSLSIYDTDGLEGLYVPSSSFRETSQDIASSALSSNVSMNNGSYNNSFSQWGMQAIQNAYQQTTNAISKAVKKNKAKLKYGTFVYLINTKDKKNN